MEEEIDLRPYLEALLGHWKWIVGAAIVAGAIAFGVSFLLPPTYAATALVAITEPREIVQFDPRIRAVEEAQPLRAYPELATSDALLQELLAEVGPLVPEVDTIPALRDMLSAEAGADPSLLRLTVTYATPEETAVIANTWADLFVTKANRIYGGQGGEQLAFFENQFEDSRVQLETAEQALIDFQARNRSVILGNRLEALQQTQSDQLQKQRQITLLLQDITGLQTQLASVGSNNDSTDQLAMLLLQVRAFSGPSSEVASPWQIQVDAGQRSEATGRDQLALLEGLQTALTAQLDEIDARLAELEPQILAVQQEKQAADTEEAELTRERDVAEETYTTLARKVEEERITSQDISGGVRLASRAATSTATSSNTIQYTLLAAIMASLIVTCAIIVLTWWNQIRHV